MIKKKKRKKGCLTAPRSSAENSCGQDRREGRAREGTHACGESSARGKGRGIKLNQVWPRFNFRQTLNRKDFPRVKLISPLKSEYFCAGNMYRRFLRSIIRKKKGRERGRTSVARSVKDNRYPAGSPYFSFRSVRGKRIGNFSSPASKFLQRAGIEEKDIGYGETSDRNDTARQLSSD